MIWIRKSTLRWSLKDDRQDDRGVTHAVLKTIAAFLNTEGGDLLIGVSDDGDTVGVTADGFASEDKMHLHLVNLLKDRLGSQHSMYIHPRFEDRDEARVLVGVVVAAHNEPYGDFSVDRPEFAAQFKGKSIRDPFRVGADIDAVSRATITITSAARAIRISARRMATQLLAPPK